MEIRIRDLAKDFGDFPALFGVDLDIRSGELLALLGPSGSGKTTLLRILAGLEAPTWGRVFFGDEDASATSVRERRVGFVFQHYALFRHMTVADNIAFGLTVRPKAERPSRAEIARRVQELLDLVQLPDLARRYPSQLSGGQRQRVALARALAVEPRVLFLDEPFGALDAQVRKDLRKWLREIHDRTGYTTVFVTHDQDEALELADRVVVLNKGRIEQIGTPDEIYDAPASPFVFDFIGDASRIPVTVEHGGVVVDGRRLALPVEVLGQGAATLYVRPQHWTIGAPDAPGALAATVAGTRRHGVSRRLDTTLGDGRAVEIDVPPETRVAAGDRLSLLPTRWRLFFADGAAAAVAPVRDPGRVAAS
ncbi:sulfate/molybdate ABC transporter ATP-binding protein [Siculibacillus lacustris]|uniref:Sulfate/molybdate ABC transporter ATP-binding protein n=1 Tax=Siculibacillus lacustris TaxID=1549641 RepID=A0A4Q9VWJ3_9HYPH|nr:sulfate/molybdate ABC transporter ATP-binding protein [Siculibacillus lacustris]TBW40692.1 sulfate/molybdate ABC transporter ATP-binding protein [Siculibacillus lacustris]